MRKHELLPSQYLLLEWALNIQLGSTKTVMNKTKIHIQKKRVP